MKTLKTLRVYFRILFRRLFHRVVKGTVLNRHGRRMLEYLTNIILEREYQNQNDYEAAMFEEEIAEFQSKHHIDRKQAILTLTATLLEYSKRPYREP